MNRTREDEIENFAKEIGRKFYNDGHESAAYASARQGAIWADNHPSHEMMQQFVDKAVKWLSLNATLYGGFNPGCLENMVTKFKHDMEEDE